MKQNLLGWFVFGDNRWHTIYNVTCRLKGFIPRGQGSISMRKEDKTGFYEMSMISLNWTVLMMSMRTIKSLRNYHRYKGRLETTKFTSIITLNRDNIATKIIFNMVLKVIKKICDFRFSFQRENPSVFTEIINNTHSSIYYSHKGEGQLRRTPYNQEK
jgi:hypothetical protein